MADLVRPAPALEQLLKQTPINSLVSEIQSRGNPQNGALLFYKSAAACARCHIGVDGAPAVGPELGSLRTSSDSIPITEEYLVQSMLYPSKDIRPPFRVVAFLTDDEQTIVGSILREDKESVVVRPINDLTNSITIETAKIDARKDSPLSMMPDGLISSMRDQAEFFDLAAYVFEVVRGGREREEALKPTPQQLAIKEDWLDLDHAGIIKSLGKKDFDSGKSIFQGYCADCHGTDGNRPSLPTARSFGTQPMKFGADPYRMFMTLTKGNGLMGSMSHLTPHQRYEVIQYIREAFMKPSNQDFFKIDSKYLA
ncbi:MAG: c-type cytochrome, partial [bacterium]